MNPVITFLLSRRKKVSDIEFLAVKEFDGKLVHNKNERDSTGDGAILTATAAHDLYLAEAKVMFSVPGTTSVAGEARAELFINGTAEDEVYVKFTGQISGGSGGGVWSINHKFALKGRKVLATQIIKIVVTEISTSIRCNSTLIGFEELTGVDPRI